MKKMIMHIAEKKFDKVINALGLEGLGMDGLYGFVLCLLMGAWIMSIMWIVG